MFRSSIEYGIQYIYKLGSGIGLCHIYNLVVDLLQETPYFFAARLKADSDSGVNRTQKKATWGNPLQLFCFSIQLVKLIKYKKAQWGNPLAKLRLLSSLRFPKRAKNS